MASPIRAGCPPAYRLLLFRGYNFVVNFLLPLLTFTLVEVTYRYPPDLIEIYHLIQAR